MRTRDKGDVAWHAPKRKRPIAWSTIATKEWIDVLSSCGLTVEQMHRASVMDEDARKVLEAYMALGHGGKTGAELRFEGHAVGERDVEAVRRILAEAGRRGPFGRFPDEAEM